MIFKGQNQIGKLHLGNAIGKVFIGQDQVFSSYSGPTFGDYDVGDIVPIKCGGVPVNCVVVHQGNPNSAVYDASCDGTWLMFCDAQEITSSNLLAYPVSALKTTTMAGIYNSVDASFKANVKTVKLPCVALENNEVVSYTGSNGIECNVFPLSLNEAGYTVSSESYTRINHDVGTKLDYFLLGNDSAAGARRNQYLQQDYEEEEYDGWYTRGFYYTDSRRTYNAALAENGGNEAPQETINTNNSATCAVRPALIVKPSARPVDVSSFLTIHDAVSDASLWVTFGGKQVMKRNLPIYLTQGTVTIGLQPMRIQQSKLNVYENGVLKASGENDEYDTWVYISWTPTANEYNMTVTTSSSTVNIYLTEVTA